WSAGCILVGANANFESYNNFIAAVKPSSAKTSMVNSPYNSYDVHKFKSGSSGIYAGYLVIDRHLYKDVMTKKIYKNAKAVNSITKFSTDAYAAACQKYYAPDAVSGVNAISSSYNSVKVTWNAVSGAQSYEIYRASSADGSYTRVGASTTTAFTEAGLATGSYYYYKVRALDTVDGNPVTGAFSAADPARPLPTKPAIAAERLTSTSVRIHWGKVDGADGYTVYRALSKGGSYKVVKRLEGGDQLSLTRKKLTTGITCYYKVRAYRNVDGKRVYGPYSSVKSATP
ncbi:MAG: hypothetical protein IJP03_06210, partial [Christensenellaceae bacterium]|nr:hypothetical protein [Christensenellaceae bacterium]